MPRTSLLDLSLALQASLTTELPALVDEVNLGAAPDIPIAMPDAVSLGVRVEMLKRALPELPAIACGVYVRESHDELEQAVSAVALPYVIDVYLGNEDADALYVQAQKWAMVIDLWVERFAPTLVDGLTPEEAPDLDISYTLSERDGSFRQLVGATGTFFGWE